MEGRKPSFRITGADRVAFFGQQSKEVTEEPKKSKSKKDKKAAAAEPLDATPIYRHIKAQESLTTSPSEDIRTLSDLFQSSIAKYGDNPGLGTRQKNADGTFGEYKWITWGEVGARVKNFGAGLRAVCGVSLGDKVGIYAKNRVEWIVSMEACNGHGLVTVALYDTFGAENLTYVVNHSELTTVIGSIDRIQNLLQLGDQMTGVKHLVTMDYEDEEKISTLKKLSKKHGIKLHTFAEIEEKGVEVADKKSYKLPKFEPDHLSVIMYTSGTTGNPKGAMISHGNILSVVAAVPECIRGVYTTDVYISYLPLAHIFERTVTSALVFSGARIGFYQGDVTKLTEDMSVLKPTLMAAAPRVLNRIYQRINDNVSSTGGIKAKLFKMGLKSKTKAIAKHKDKGAFDFVFKRPKSVTGGSLRLVLSGSAPLTPEVQSFVRSVLGCPVVQGYGLTETCAGATVASPDDVDCVGEVGPPLTCCEIKLVSVPELNYFAKDKKGEVWIRGPNICKGYYKDEEKTKEDFDADGWFHTGDIGVFTERGTLKIVDRKKNIFKLSQGEYVAAEVLENIYLKSPFVDQIWVHGDSTQSTLVAVINVNQKNCLDWAEKHGVTLTGDHPIKSLLNHDGLKKAIMTALSDMARAEKRSGFEIIKRVHLIDYEFNAENDFATPTAKLKRPQLRAAFKAEIDAMYDEINKEETARSGAAPADAKGKGKADEKPKAEEKAKDSGKGKAKDAAAKTESKKDSKQKAESSAESSADAKKKPSKASDKKPADSESDGDVPSSSESDAKKPSAKAAPKKAAVKEASDESSESSSKEKKPAPKQEQKSKPAAKKVESSSGSDESSSEAPAAKPSLAKKAATSSSNESSSEEKPATKKPAAKKAASSSESSESSSSEAPAPKKAAATKKADASSESDTESESSSSEEKKPAKSKK